jgi:hypothetical protein
MKAYHRTNSASAAAILRDGFRDGRGRYVTDQMYLGVWMSDRSLDANEGAEGDAVVEIEIPEELFAVHEWIEPGRSFREAVVPAAVVISFPRRLVDD